MLTLNDGRSELWQWDTGRKLTVDDDCSQVHFSNKVFGRSIDVDVVDGVAIIPDILLQTDKDLTAWAFVGTPENGYTKISKTFNVNRRNKPADYVFTATDQTTLGEILDRIEDLENRPSGDISKEDIQNAVNDYLEKNPVSVDETDPTVPAWAKEKEKPKYTAKEVGALPNTTAIPVVPSALPNPHKLTINGAVQAEYDGSKAVTLTIPESSSISGKWQLLKSVDITEEVRVLDFSEPDWRYDEIYIMLKTTPPIESTGKQVVMVRLRDSGGGVSYSLEEALWNDGSTRIDSFVYCFKPYEAELVAGYGVRKGKSMVTGDYNHKVTPNSYINSFQIYADADNFGVGTHIEFWGR